MEILEINANHEISKEKFDGVIRELKEGKASGIDEIPSEILKLGGEELPNILYELILRIHDTEDFKKNIMILIPKIVGANNCKDFRTLFLPTHE